MQTHLEEGSALRRSTCQPAWQEAVPPRGKSRGKQHAHTRGPLKGRAAVPPTGIMRTSHVRQGAQVRRQGKNAPRAAGDKKGMRFN